MLCFHLPTSHPLPQTVGIDIALGLMSISFLCLSPPLSFRGLIGATLWAELEMGRHVNDAVDTLQRVDDFFNQYGKDVSI